jgi:type IV secretory pathway TrbL component
MQLLILSCPWCPMRKLVSLLLLAPCLFCAAVKGVPTDLKNCAGPEIQAAVSGLFSEVAAAVASGNWVATLESYVLKYGLDTVSCTLQAFIASAAKSVPPGAALDPTTIELMARAYAFLEYKGVQVPMPDLHK